MAAPSAANPLGWQTLAAAYEQYIAPKDVEPQAFPNQILYLGLSGGMDSMVLLDLAHRWVRQAQLRLGADPVAPKPRLVALHAHHGLQEAAERWLQFCRQQCAALGVELVSQRLQLPRTQSSEAAARTARYDFFAAQVARQPGLLLLGHHADDQTETLLLRLAQGRGAVGMPTARRFASGWLLRPLLARPRADLQAYADANNLAWQEDPSNQDIGYDRNWLRHQVVPAVVQRWPGFNVNAARWAGQQREQNQLLQDLLSRQDSLPVPQLQQASGPALLHAWLSSKAETAPSRRALAEFCRQLGASSDASPRLELTAGELRRYRQQVHYVAKQAAVEMPCHLSLLSPAKVQLPHGVLQVAGPVASLQVRFAARLAGSRFAPAIPRSRWQAANIAPWQRATYPQLFAQNQRLGLPQNVPGEMSWPSLASAPAITPGETESQPGPEAALVAESASTLLPLLGARANSAWRARWTPHGGTL